MTDKSLKQSAIKLLQEIVRTPSFSTEEEFTSQLISEWFESHQIEWKREKNNVWSINRNFDVTKPTILLNSHHDTVNPNKAYTRDPFDGSIEGDKLYGLGSNDAGGPLVSLLATFANFYAKKDMKYNLVMVASAEEENNGANGLKDAINFIPEIDVAIVGEPTKMNLAIAEKGLVVFDAKIKGTPGHAAHVNGDNVMYKIIEVLDWFKKFEFKRKSDILGPVKMTVTQINGGQHHNIIPAEIDLVVDVRVNDLYTNQDISDLLQKESPCFEMIPRSLNLNSSSIPKEHELVQAGIALGLSTYGSPTLSDQAVLSCPSLKLGPGDSLRSHSADEFIYLEEIESAIDIYIKLLDRIL